MWPRSQETFVKNRVCWYYRNPGNTFHCLRKGGDQCDALFAENRYHSIFGAMRVHAAPCVTGCPIHNDIPTYMEQLREGKIDAAVEILMRSNPFPAITGRACAHFCEDHCNRNGFDEAVSIRDIERFLGDYALAYADDFYLAPVTESGKHVAVVGSGPAGLATAYFLRKKGHSVTVFDRMTKAGGMLTYSIPAYRLPKHVVRKAIKALKSMGIHFELGMNLERDGFTLEALRNRFQSVFLGTGLWIGKRLKLEKGEMLESGLEFLIKIQTGIKPLVGNRVVVIGGGSVAADVAISAHQLGASQVTIACLECLEEMPAIPEDIEQVHQEGIELLPSWGPQRVIDREGKLVGIELVRCTSVFDSSGRFNPTFNPLVTETIEADQVFLAIGQIADLSYAGNTLGTERGIINIDPSTSATSLEGVFAGGDVAGGPATLVHAIASGTMAAGSIDTYLCGGASPTIVTQGQEQLVLNQNALTSSSRVPTPHLPVMQRTLMGEDSTTINEKYVVQEAQRCVNCGCVAVNASDLATALVALEAKVVTTKRRLSAIEMFAAKEMKTTVLENDELIKEIQIPHSNLGSHQRYYKFRIRNAIDFPLVSVAFCTSMKDGKFHEARVVLGAVAPIPLRIQSVEQYLEGREPDTQLAEEAGRIAVQVAQPLARNKAQIQIVKALVARAIQNG